MDERLGRFVRALYFDIQRIDGVNPLEIWNGIREFDDPFEKISLVKNLYKIVVPLVNEAFFDRPFERHALSAGKAVSELLRRVTKGLESRLFDAFPDPPVGDSDQKKLYHAVKAEAVLLVKRALEDEKKSEAVVKTYPDGLFDFREMRVVDNELPYIIFTDKEFRVIHGLVIVYLWLIDLESLFIRTLRDNGVGEEIPEGYASFARRVLKENPLVLQGRKVEPRELASRLDERLKHGDYLDVFENVYRWFETTRDRFAD